MFEKIKEKWQLHKSKLTLEHIEHLYGAEFKMHTGKELDTFLKDLGFNEYHPFDAAMCVLAMLCDKSIFYGLIEKFDHGEEQRKFLYTMSNHDRKLKQTSLYGGWYLEYDSDVMVAHLNKWLHKNKLYVIRHGNGLIVKESDLKKEIEIYVIPKYSRHEKTQLLDMDSPPCPIKIAMFEGNKVSISRRLQFQKHYDMYPDRIYDVYNTDKPNEHDYRESMTADYIAASIFLGRRLGAKYIKDDVIRELFDSGFLDKKEYRNKYLSYSGLFNPNEDDHLSFLIKDIRNSPWLDSLFNCTNEALIKQVETCSLLGLEVATFLEASSGTSENTIEHIEEINFNTETI